VRGIDRLRVACSNTVARQRVSQRDRRRPGEGVSKDRGRPGEGVSKEPLLARRGCLKGTAAGPERVSQRMQPAGERVAHRAAVAKSKTAVGGGEISARQTV